MKQGVSEGKREEEDMNHAHAYKTCTCLYRIESRKKDPAAAALCIFR